MEIPSQDDPRWEDLICKECKHKFSLFATKLMLGRLNLKYRMQKSPEILEESIKELREFFQKNIHLPKIQSDLKKIFG